jgi:hypothetical protein
MALLDDLLELEKRLWTGDAEEYRSTVADECLIAFAKTAGVMSRDEVASTVGGGARWSEPTTEVRGLLQPTRDFAVLTYEAKTTRQSKNAEPYKALVTSGYVKHGQEWKLAFHQQTPLA